MKIIVDTDIEVLGHTLKSIAEETDSTGQHNLYHFPNNIKPLTICTQLFLDGGDVAYTVAKGIYTMQEYKEINFCEVESVTGIPMPLSEFPEELTNSLKEILSPDFFEKSWWGKCNKLRNL